MAEAKKWLVDHLVKTLGWEAAEAGGLVDAIAAATPAERNGIVEARLGDPPPFSIYVLPPIQAQNASLTAENEPPPPSSPVPTQSLMTPFSI